MMFEWFMDYYIPIVMVVLPGACPWDVRIECHYVYVGEHQERKQRVLGATFRSGWITS